MYGFYVILPVVGLIVLFCYRLWLFYFGIFEPDYDAFLAPGAVTSVLHMYDILKFHGRPVTWTKTLRLEGPSEHFVPTVTDPKYSRTIPSSNPNKVLATDPIWRLESSSEAIFDRFTTTRYTSRNDIDLVHSPFPDTLGPFAMNLKKNGGFTIVYRYNLDHLFDLKQQDREQYVSWNIE